MAIWTCPTMAKSTATMSIAMGQPGERAMEEANDDQLEWRDTYFVLFQQSRRPTLTQVEAAITETSRRLTLENLEADEDGMFEPVLVHAPQDNAAVEISYEVGDAVIEQSAELAKQLKDEIGPKQLQQMLKSNARLDVMLFERVRNEEFGGDEEADDEEWGGAVDP